MVSVEYLIRYLDEDTPFGDVTSEAVILPDTRCRAVIRAEEDGIIAGTEEASLLFSHFGISVDCAKKDGDTVARNQVVLFLNGDARRILMLERTVLNIIARMSGIATLTRKMMTIVTSVNPSCRIASTRKTCPGFRALDKKAIKIGGGDPHRMSLSDGVLIKDNHLVLVSIKDAIQAAKRDSAYRKIEVEVETASDAVSAASEGADIILLDNMDPRTISRTIEELKAHGLRERVTIELSGGINETSLPLYASLGADRISMGSLTHSVKNFPVTLEIQHP